MHRKLLRQHAHSHAWIALIHSHTLHQHSYNHVVQSTSSAIIFQCMLKNPDPDAGSFRVSVIHRTLTWITGSLTF